MNSTLYQIITKVWSFQIWQTPKCYVTFLYWCNIIFQSFWSSSINGKWKSNHRIVFPFDGSVRTWDVQTCQNCLQADSPSPFSRSNRSPKCSAYTCNFQWLNSASSGVLWKSKPPRVSGDCKIFANYPKMVETCEYQNILSSSFETRQWLVAYHTR